MGVVDGTWINDDVEWATWPKWLRDIAKAKQLMAEAGVPNGFNVDCDADAELLSARRAHRVALVAIGIRAAAGDGTRCLLKKMQGGCASGPACRSFSMPRGSAGPGPTGHAMFKCGGFNAKTSSV
jgi:hypothetical protein